MKTTIITLCFLLLGITVQAQTGNEALPGQEEYLKATVAERAENYSEALEYYTIAAEKGNADAMYNLGYMYEYGQGMDINDSDAMKWYIKAIRKGHTNAMIALGIMYFNADLYEESENCLKMALEKGNTGAYDVLGFAYFMWGRYEEALPCFTKAASGDAFYFLGEMYDRGLGVESNEEKALEYYKKAATEGNEQAKKVLEER